MQKRTKQTDEKCHWHSNVLTFQKWSADKSRQDRQEKTEKKFQIHRIRIIHCKSRNLPFHVKRLVTENENLKAEIQTLQDAQEMVTKNENLKAETQTLQDAQENITIRSNCAVTPAQVRLAKYDKCL